MSRVSVTELLTGATATAANLNATMNSFVSMSSDVDDNNVRESGLWRQAFTTRALTPSDGYGTFTAAGPSAVLGTTAGLDVGFTVGSAVKVGAINNATISDQTLVRFSTGFTISTATTARTLQFVLTYSTDDITYTAIEATRRKFSWRFSAIDGELGTTLLPKDCVTIVHKFVTTNSATLYFRPAYRLDQGGVTLHNAQLTAEVYAK